MRDKTKTTLGDRIGMMLKKRNMTQKSLAQGAGITEAAVSHYIKGDREPRSTTLKEIAKVLGVSTSYLLDADTAKAVMKQLVKVQYKEIKALLMKYKDGLTDKQKKEIVRMLTEQMSQGKKEE